MRRHLEPRSLRGIICDNPLKPGQGRKPKKPVVPPEALQHYQDVGKLAAQALEEDGILAVPVENWALQHVIAAIAPQLPYWRTMVQIFPDTLITVERYSLSCKYIVLFSAGSPNDLMADADPDQIFYGVSPWKSDCELHILLAPETGLVLHIAPSAQTVGELLHWKHPVTAVYGLGSDLDEKWRQIEAATVKAKEVHGELAPASENTAED